MERGLRRGLSAPPSSCQDIPENANFAIATLQKAAKAKIIYVAFSTLKKNAHAEVHISARGKSLAAVRTELLGHYPTVDPKAAKQGSVPRRKCET